MTERLFKYKYSKRVLAINENYTDWLIDYFRRQNQTKQSLVTGYFDQESNNLINAQDKKTFLGFWTSGLVRSLKFPCTIFFAYEKLLQVEKIFFSTCNTSITERLHVYSGSVYTIYRSSFYVLLPEW